MITGFNENDYNSLSARNLKLINGVLNRAKSNSTCGMTQRNGNENILFDPVRYRSRLKTTPQDRLLSLAIYWNNIKYYYPFRKDTQIDWSIVLEEFIPKIMNCQTELEYHLTLLELASLTNDGHAKIRSSLIDNYWGYYKIPISLELIQDDLFVTKLYSGFLSNSLIEIGDQMLAIDNVTFEEFSIVNLKYMSGPDETSKLMNLAKKYLYRKTKKPVHIKLQREEKIYEFVVNPVHGTELSKETARISKNKEAFKILNDSIAYLNLSITQPDSLGTYFKQFETYPSIILDIRNYPNNILDSLARYFFDKPRKTCRWYSPDLTHPGEFVNRDCITLGSQNSNYYKGKIVLLVNHGTFSQGEYIAMAMQSLPNTITVGQKTSGTDGDVSKFRLPGGIGATFTCLKIVYPAGYDPYRVGLKLDYEFTPKHDLLKKDPDPELTFALKVLNDKRR